MKLPLLTIAFLSAVNAGTIVGNVGFTVYDDPAAWANAHPHATAASPFGVAAADGSSYLTADLGFLGQGLSFSYLGDTPAVSADPTHGVALQITPLATNLYGFSFYFTPLPGGTYEQIVAYGNAGNDLDYYDSSGGTFFFGITSEDPITKIALLTPYGGPQNAQQVVVYGFQQDQAETPEPGTVWFVSVPLCMAAGIRRWIL